MKNIQLFGVLTVIAGSFLPLVKIPIIGNWNYFQLESSFAIIVYLITATSLFALLGGKYRLVKLMGVLLILLFLFTIAAVKYKSIRFFSFLPFDTWVNFAAGVVKLKWGWIVEFLGAFLMLFTYKKRKLI